MPAATVLIVDDQPEFRALLREIVERAGFRVVGEAADGADAVGLAAALRPDVITMDLDMPILDGASATAAIAQNHASAIVIVSGSSSSEHVGDALQAGARWHVAKRDVATELAVVLEAIVGESSRGIPAA